MQEMCTMETHNRGNRIYKYKIKESIDCKITDIIYCIYCTKCKKKYTYCTNRRLFLPTNEPQLKNQNLQNGGSNCKILLYNWSFYGTLQGYRNWKSAWRPNSVWGKGNIIGTETKDVWTKTLTFWKNVDFYTFSIFYCLMINNWIRHGFHNLETASPKCISMECVV